MSDGKNAINVRRGLFRLWLVLSVLWIGFVVIWIGLNVNDWSDPAALFQVIAFISLVPIGFVLALGLAIIWTFRGFQRNA